MRPLSVWGWILVAGLGCSDAGNIRAGDAGPPDARTDAQPPEPELEPAPPALPEGTPAEPAAPAAPAAPSLEPCPDGWRVVAHEEDPTVCDPWPDSGRVDCAAHEAHLPGTAGCTRVGDSCPADGLPENLPPEADVRYVAAGADPTAADGSRANPYASLGAALAGAAPGTVVAIGVGTYAERVELPEGVSLFGACTEGTVIRAPTAASTTGTVVIRDPGAYTVRNLRIGPGDRPGISTWHEEASLTLEHVVIEDARGIGLLASGSAVVGHDLVVRGTRPLFDGTRGYGFAIQAGTEVELERVLLIRNHSQGLLALEGTTVRLSDAAVVATQPRTSDLERGRGIEAHGGTTVELHRVVIEEAHEAGVLASGPGASMRIEDLVVRDVEAGGLGGWGLTAIGNEEGAPSVEVRRAVFEGNRDTGVQSVRGADVLLEDVVIRDTRPPRAGMDGAGIAVFDEGRLAVHRMHLARNPGLGIYLSDAGSEAEIEDVVIRHIVDDENEADRGDGLVVERGGAVTLRRGLLEDVQRTGATVNQGSSLVAEDLTVRGVRASNGGVAGRGIGVQIGSSLVLRRGWIDGTVDAGLAIQAGSTGEVHDLTVEDVDPGGGPGGRAVDVDRGSTLTAERVHLERHHTGGLVAIGDGATITVDDLTVRDALASSSNDFGFALGAGRGAEVRVRSAVLEGGHGGGAVANAPGSSLALTDVWIRDTLPGPDGLWGRGISIHSGARLALSRVALERQHESAIFALGTEVEANDVLARDTASRAADGTKGRGLTLGLGSTGTLSRVRIERSRGTAVYLHDSHVEMSDLVISGVERQACAETSCTQDPRGYGLGAVTGATTTISRFLVEQAETCGVILLDTGETSLTDGVVSGSAIGACLGDEDVDLRTLSSSVRYVDNGRNLDASRLPVPEPGEGGALLD